MKWAYHVKYKLKAAIVLTGIIVIILVSNLSERKSFSNLDHSMSSIYNDRLKPASYIYDITNALYQKRLLLDNDKESIISISASLQEHDEHISELIEKFEATFLTKEEKKKWNQFKNHLHQYNEWERQWIVNNMNTNTFSQAEIYFNQTLNDLNSLNKIQIGEGNNLQKQSKSVINSTIIISYLEISLLIILGLCTLILLSVSDNTLFRQNQNQAFN